MDVNVRVVSMPCWELFAEQPPGLSRRGAPARGAGARSRSRPAISLGWERWIGDAGRLGRDRPLRRLGARRRGAGAARLHGRERGRQRATALLERVADEGRGRVRPPRRQAARARARGAGGARHEVVDLGTDTDAVRIDYPDKARELGEAIQRGGAERGVLVCGSGVGASRRGLQDARDPRRDLPRRLLRAPGCRARRHERALPRLGDRRRRAGRRARPRRSSARGSTAASATWSG